MSIRILLNKNFPNQTKCGDGDLGHSQAEGVLVVQCVSLLGSSWMPWKTAKMGDAKALG